MILIIRGLPGSGKTTLAKKFADLGFIHVEADMFFEKDGSYQYDPSRIKDAHEWCYDRVREAALDGKNVAVANTFIQRWTAEPYFALAREIGVPVKVITTKGRYKNVHNVPEEAIAKMAERWEEF